MSGTGLCGSCQHHRWIEARRGARYLLCERSRTDRRLPRYPPLPVLRCDGYEPATTAPPRGQERPP
jgi:hypothetical protein